MPRYSVKSSFEKAFKFINLVKSLKYGRSFEVHAKPKTRIQKELIDEMLSGFFGAIKNIKDGLE
jgi:hypothetical protein